MEGKSALCKKALDFFIQVYGAEAGNLALKLMATGGVWLGGGIIKHLSEYVRDTPTFMRSFTSKGRLGHLVERIPVRIIVNDLTALWGAVVHCIWTYDPPYDGAQGFRIVDAAADEEPTSA
jgi:glucokinase